MTRKKDLEVQVLANQSSALQHMRYRLCVDIPCIVRPDLSFEVSLVEASNIEVNAHHGFGESRLRLASKTSLISMKPRYQICFLHPHNSDSSKVPLALFALNSTTKGTYCTRSLAI